MRFLNASDFRSDVRFLRSTWTSCLPNGTEDAPALPRAGAFSFQRRASLLISQTLWCATVVAPFSVFAEVPGRALKSAPGVKTGRYLSAEKGEIFAGVLRESVPHGYAWNSKRQWAWSS